MKINTGVCAIGNFPQFYLAKCPLVQYSIGDSRSKSGNEYLNMMTGSKQYPRKVW